MKGEEGRIPEGERQAKSSKAGRSGHQKGPGKKRLPPIEASQHPPQGHDGDPGIDQTLRPPAVPTDAQAKPHEADVEDPQSPTKSDGSGEEFTFGTTNPLELPVFPPASGVLYSPEDPGQQTSPGLSAGPPRSAGEESLKAPPVQSVKGHAPTVFAPAGPCIPTLEPCPSGSWDPGTIYNGCAVPDHLAAGLPAVPQHMWPPPAPPPVDVYSMMESGGSCGDMKAEALRYSASKADYMGGPEWVETPKQASEPIELPEEGTLLSGRCMAFSCMAVVFVGGSGLLAFMLQMQR
mmetsp:Transcript_51357/g.94922  ORF Transcript_51357/g.94922 Transcript_51357/m.94922 type:complete len:292 (-) Transcript_51357:193-1068(-)